MQDDLKTTHQEVNQFTTGDRVELLEDFSIYNKVQYGPSTSKESSSGDIKLSPELFQTPEMKKNLKLAFVDCVHHYEEIMKMAKDYEELTSTWFLFKLGDITFLMTLILIAIVRISYTFGKTSLKKCFLDNNGRLYTRHCFLRVFDDSLNRAIHPLLLRKRTHFPKLKANKRNYHVRVAHLRDCHEKRIDDFHGASY